MRLHRYELYCDGEEQKVGFIVGLNLLYETDLCTCGPSMDDYIDGLIEPFNDELPFPPDEASHCICAFTEFGDAVFKDAIQRIVAAYEDTIFEVKEIVMEIEDDELDKLAYYDGYQACLSLDLYQRLKHETAHFQMMSAIERV